MHAEFPDKYKDPNHKPEIAIGLTEDFKACYGFSSAAKIKANLDSNPALAAVFPLGDKASPDEEYLETIVKKMFYELDIDANKDQLI